MARINLSHIQHKCAKQGCSHIDAPLARHHRKSEKMFIHAFHRRKRSTRFKRFKATYKKFRPRDVVKICDWHHREIHEMYHRMVEWEKARRRKRLRDFTWKEAYNLMNKLEQACNRWLNQVTPGSPPWPARN